MVVIVSVLYVVAAGLELVGIGLALFDLRKVQRRLRNYVERPQGVFASDHLIVSPKVTGSASVAGSEPTLASRVDALETWQAQLPDELEKRDAELSARVATTMRGELQAVSSTIADRIDGIRDALGKPDRWWWRGPALLAVGVIVGTVGNFLSLHLPPG